MGKQYYNPRGKGYIRPANFQIWSGYLKALSSLFL